MTTWNVKLATKMCSRTKVVNVGTCKNKTLLSTIWEEGLFIPAYLGGFYQPSNAVCLGKRAMVAEGLSKSGLVGATLPPETVALASRDLRYNWTSKEDSWLGRGTQRNRS